MNHNMKKTRQQRRGFTLIELLVVMTIITLLISILLPALSAARDAARTLSCMSNERQAMLGLNMYTLDHNGFLPYGEDEDGIYWPGKINASYINDPAVFMCPDRLDEGNDRAVINYLNTSPPESSGFWKYTSYSCNHLGAMPDYNSTNRSPIRITETLVPTSKLLLLTEAYRPDKVADYGYYGYYMTSVPSSVYSLWTHGNVTNTAFLDGHCESMKSIELGWDPHANQQDMTHLVDGWQGFPWYISTAIH